MRILAGHIEGERQEERAVDYPARLVVEVDLPILDLIPAQPRTAGQNCRYGWRIPAVSLVIFIVALYAI